MKTFPSALSFNYSFFFSRIVFCRLCQQISIILLAMFAVNERAPTHSQSKRRGRNGLVAVWWKHNFCVRIHLRRSDNNLPLKRPIFHSSKHFFFILFYLFLCVCYANRHLSYRRKNMDHWTSGGFIGILSDKKLVTELKMGERKRKKRAHTNKYKEIKPNKRKSTVLNKQTDGSKWKSSRKPSNVIEYLLFIWLWTSRRLLNRSKLESCTQKTIK